MFTLHEIVPWGRSFEEYRRMFVLSDADLGVYPKNLVAFDF
jgi:hypothetical protein